jgi:uncharacterized protein (DUF1015 family)
VTAVHAFDGALVRPSWAGRVVAPMFDSLSPDERREILVTNPDSYLHVSQDRPDSGGDRNDTAPWGEGALKRLLRLGAYETAPAPMMYVYRLEADDRTCTGVVAEVEATAFRDGRVLGHEAVQPARVEALTEHFATVSARSALVALLHDSGPEHEAAVRAVCAAEPVLAVTGAGGVRESVWPVADAHLQALFAKSLGAGTSYIADGHHRVAATLRAWDLSGQAHGHSVLSVFYGVDEMRPLAFHRRVRGPVDADRLLGALGEGFVVEPGDGPRRIAGGFDLYERGRWWAVRPRDPARPSGAAGLDVAVLHDRVLEPILGIAVAGDPALELVPELAPLGELTERCDRDDGVLFVLVPPTVKQLIEVADRGEVMIPKTTFFDPKPLSGVFLQF